MLNCMATCRRMDKKPSDNKVNTLADATRNLAPNFGGMMKLNAIEFATDEVSLGGVEDTLKSFTNKVGTTAAFNAVEEANNLINSEAISVARKLTKSVSFGKQLPLRRATCADHRVNSAEVRRTGPR